VLHYHENRTNNVTFTMSYRRKSVSRTYRVIKPLDPGVRRGDNFITPAIIYVKVIIPAKAIMSRMN
jgi:hypothetical protein